jgi:3-oxoadipate enol-lactonase
MPYAVTSDEVKLYYEEVGRGTPILFVHEFAGDHRSWELQLRELGKRYRCITYVARGYRPSDVSGDPAAYSYMHVMRDAVTVLDHLQIDRAHLIGLSMGGYTALQVALNHPGRVWSLVLAGTGSGSERWYTEDFHKRSRDLAVQFEKEGSAAVAQTYGRSASRITFRIRAALPNFPANSPNTMRKAPRTCRADFRAHVLRSTISKQISESWKCRR